MEIHTIRHAAAEDLDRIWPMVRRAVAKMNAEGSEQWGEDYPTRAHYEDDLRRGQLLCAVSAAGDILGVCCASLDPEPTYEGVPWTIEGPALVIHRMAVDPSAQRSGVASALLERAMEEARAKGARAVHMDTYCKNEKMQGLFRRLGFTQRGTIHLHGRALPYPAFEREL